MAAQKKASAASEIKFAGLPAAIEDARVAAASTDDGPKEPSHYDELVARLKAVKDRFPPVYEQGFVGPYLATVEALSPAKFARVLASDPDRVSSAGLLFDLAQAILQHGEGYQKAPTRAYQELTSDLYDGFLSAEDRHGVKPPDRGVIPPLAKWGNPTSGPYTWPVDATASFGVKAGVVNLPPANATSGVVGWAALGHETAGHDILHADSGLQEELASAVRAKLKPLGHGLADYWADRIDETASDVMGLLNIGPSAGIGLIALFRGWSLAMGEPPVLRSEGPAGDVHPADIVRGYLAAELIALLTFSKRGAWSKAIARETDKDRKTIVLAGVTIAPALARKSAQIVAQTLALTKVAALEQHALADIQNWSDADEALVDGVREAFRTGGPLPAAPADRPLYAAHLVAAATVEAVTSGQGIPALQQRMIAELDALHDKNPSWGPLFVTHPGQLHRDFARAGR